MTSFQRPLSPTEQRNPASSGLDDLDTLGVLRVLNTEDRAVIDAVAAALPQLAELVDIAAERMRRGGRVHYFGAGTSGRLGVLDASELLPTFKPRAGPGHRTYRRRSGGVGQRRRERRGLRC